MGFSRRVRQRMRVAARAIDPASLMRVAQVDALNDDGRGVARIDGKVTFIDGALPGERVSVFIEASKRHYDHARVIEVLEPSPDRVSPACAHFGVCGGCSLQHLGSEAQIREKEAVLRERLQHFGGVTAGHWLPPLIGPAWHYRRSARLGARHVEKKGGVLVGFRERRSRFIAPLEHCEILDARVADRLPALRELISGLSCRDRIPQVEVACGDQDVALVFRHLEPLTEADQARLTEFGRSHDFRIYTQASGPESVVSLWPRSEDAAELLTYRLPAFDLTMAFRPTDFIQVNGEINRRVVERAIELMGPNSTDHVVDLFCGLGNFTLPLARSAGRVVGVESETRLLERARANAVRNGIANAEFRCADLYDEAMVRDMWRGLRADKLLLDPPRGGAMETLKHLPEPEPSRIVYVSCNPATLARDAEYLVNHRRYRLVHAGVMDMFPHTSHVESIASFELA